MLFHPDFVKEVEEMDQPVRIELLAILEFLKIDGPQRGRTHVDTLEGSEYANMKELRFAAGDGVWRAAFDPRRRAVVLVAGDKSGVSQKRFYRSLIKVADERFAQWLKENP